MSQLEYCTLKCRWKFRRLLSSGNFYLNFFCDDCIEYMYMATFTVFYLFHKMGAFGYTVLFLNKNNMVFLFCSWDHSFPPNKKSKARRWKSWTITRSAWRRHKEGFHRSNARKGWSYRCCRGQPTWWGRPLSLGRDCWICHPQLQQTVSVSAAVEWTNLH